MPKTWKQKLEDGKEPKLTVLEKPMAGAPAGGTLLTPTPKLLQALIDTMPYGQSVKFADLRAQLAREHGGDVACPITTSMHARIVAEAAWEDLQAGKDEREVTPFWRVIEPTSSVAQKLACGPGFIEAMRAREGLS